MFQTTYLWEEQNFLVATCQWAGVPGFYWFLAIGERWTCRDDGYSLFQYQPNLPINCPGGGRVAGITNLQPNINLWQSIAFFIEDICTFMS